MSSSTESKKPAISFSFGKSNNGTAGVTATNTASTITGNGKPSKYANSSVRSKIGLAGKTGTAITTSLTSAKFQVTNKRQRRGSLSRTEAITGFDNSGAVSDHNPDQQAETLPLVIPAVQNRNWIEEVQKKRSRQIYKPVGQVIDDERNRQADEQERKSVQDRTYGLTTFANKQVDQVNEEPTITTTIVTSTINSASSQTSGSKIKTTTADEQEISKLISEFQDNQDLHLNSTLVLPLAQSSSRQITEDEAYSEDVKTRPEEPSLEDYEAVPVEEFGYALLRGMGWKEGEGIGRNRNKLKPKK
ncbi:DExH-box splicing factor binding site-domain-containing protein [Lipomyces japonicus]|uniref:DExH-box splicing factor binding site-domain-containing protein n=1 Tax=Lipomyces japonicus TaxID=56871 RepID=UPI0034CDA687